MDRRELLVAVGAHGLPGRAGCFPDQPPPPEEWSALLQHLRLQKLTGLAILAADDGALPLNAEQRDQLESEHLESTAQVLRLEAQLLSVRDTLVAAGVPFAVLKGAAVAHLDYPAPSLRAYVDNDVLIPSERFDDAVAALLQTHSRPARELGPGFDRQFGKGATLVWNQLLELDVHRTLAMGPYGLTVDLDELWSDPEAFELGGQAFTALGTEQRFLHACFHAVVGNPLRNVQPYRDVAEMLLFGSYDAGLLCRLAESWRAGAVLARAVLDTWEVLGLEPAPEVLRWARDRPLTRVERYLLSVYGPGASYASKSLAGVLVLPGVRRRASFLRYLLMPGRDYAHEHGRSTVGWVGTGTRRALRGLRRASD